MVPQSIDNQSDPETRNGIKINLVQVIAVDRVEDDKVICYTEFYKIMDEK